MDEAPNVAVFFGCLLAGCGYDVDWPSVAAAALLCEQLVDVPADEPPKEAGEP